jgi:hypothetical protein
MTVGNILFARTHPQEDASWTSPGIRRCIRERHLSVSPMPQTCFEWPVGEAQPPCLPVTERCESDCDTLPPDVVEDLARTLGEMLAA